jgi:glyoxylase-like metal-dependent hydrolase (beta-lactamase superfamily II)
MLEDDFTYVLRKALLGHGLAPAQLAAKAGVPENEVLAFSRGSFSADLAARVAPALGLDAAAFAAHVSYQPKTRRLPGIRRMDLPFGDERVNAWIVSHGGQVWLFDAGFAATDLMAELGARSPDLAFITHHHRDHVGGLEKLREAGVPVRAAGITGTIPMSAGDSLKAGGLEISAVDLSGHAVPALGFLIRGLEAPVMIMGDALFAGSIGGCGSPEIYQMALRNLRAALADLPDETILLPGHGPATTLGEERVSNPFIAGH